MRKLRYFFGGRLFPCALIFAASVSATIVLAVWLPRALAPVALAERLFSLIAALFIVCAKEPPQFKLSKIVLIVFLPWTGAILALVWLRRTPTANPPETEKCLAESIEYFPVGKEMFERLCIDVANAKKFIWLEYYIVAHGAFFHALSEILERKAREGVDVRLLYDDFGCSFTLPKRFEKEQARRGIKAYAVRRIRFPSRTANRRNHRKIAVIDGEIAYTGGINLADEYIGEKIRFGHWKDTAVRMTGAPAAAFTKLILSDMPRGIELPEIKPQKGTIPCVVIADPAEDTHFRAGGAALSSLVHAAQNSVWLFTPYLAPDAALQSALETAARAGRDVRIMIPHIPDKKFTFLITQSYARELEGAGVQIREYTAGFLHAKSLACDSKHAFVSTYNLDFRSLYLQAECGLYAESEELAGALECDFLSVWEAGTPLKKANPLKRAVGAVLRLFAPLV